MKVTTIRIHENTKKMLDDVKTYPRETYEDIIKKLITFWRDSHERSA